MLLPLLLQPLQVWLCRFRLHRMSGSWTKTSVRIAFIKTAAFENSIQMDCNVIYRVAGLLSEF